MNKILKFYLRVREDHANSAPCILVQLRIHFRVSQKSTACSYLASHCHPRRQWIECSHGSDIEKLWLDLEQTDSEGGSHLPLRMQVFAGSQLIRDVLR